MPVEVKVTSYQLLTRGLTKEQAHAALETRVQQSVVDASQAMVDAAAAAAAAAAAQATADAAKKAAGDAAAQAVTAAATAAGAQTLAGSKTAVFYSDSAPSNPINGYYLRQGDLWYDTSTYVDSDSISKVRYTPRYWTGSNWVVCAGNKLIVSSEIAAGAITADHIQASAFQTQGYTEVNGAPTAGAKLDRTAPALKVAPGNFQIGPDIFSTMWFAKAAAAWVTATISPTPAPATISTNATAGAAKRNVSSVTFQASSGSQWAGKNILRIAFTTALSGYSSISVLSDKRVWGTMAYAYSICVADVAGDHVDIGLLDAAGNPIGADTIRWASTFTIMALY